MDDTQNDPMDDSQQNPLEDLLKAILGPEAAAEAARQMESQGFDPSTIIGALGGQDQAGGAMNQLHYLFNSTSGPVNWQMVEDISKQQAYQSGDPGLSAAQGQRVRQALTIADLWLDTATDFTTADAKREAWTRVDWVNKTLPGWKQVCEPVAANASRALSEAMGQELGGGDNASFPAELSSAMPRMSAMVFGAQVGNALSALSQESYGSSDAGLPLGDPSTTALVLTNVEAFGEGLEIPNEEVLQFLAVRECAHARLYASVPWLSIDVLQAVQRYSQEIAIDPEAISAAAHSIDLQNPESVNLALSNGIFATDPTGAQKRTLERLETMLALIEGWVEVVTAQAIAPYLPHADQLQEMMRRRRVAGSPGEQMLAQLVGLHLRPRSARDAAKLFKTVLAEQGTEARDSLWQHPDFIPTAEEIANPDTFLANRQGAVTEVDEFDAELVQLLEGTLGWADGLGPDSGTNEEGGPTPK